MKLLAVVLIIACYANADYASFFDYYDSNQCERPKKDCTAPGPICEDCNTVVTCIKQDNNTFIKQHTKDCNKTNEKCLNGSCTTEDEPICDGTACLPFMCTAVGVFPDQFFCDQYHFCVGTEDSFQHFNATCDSGFAYNPRTIFCDIVLPQKICPQGYPIPLCKKAGEAAALKENPSIYYICEERQGHLYPMLFLCPHGEKYVNYGCSKSINV